MNAIWMQHECNMGKENNTHTHIQKDRKIIHTHTRKINIKNSI